MSLAVLWVARREALCLRHCHSLILRQPARRTIFLFNDCENSFMLQGATRVRRLGLRVAVTSSGIYYSTPTTNHQQLIYFHNYLLLDDCKDRPEVTTHIHRHPLLHPLSLFLFFLFVCLQHHFIGKVASASVDLAESKLSFDSSMYFLF